jgi:hypothetical protein
MARYSTLRNCHFGLAGAFADYSRSRFRFGVEPKFTGPNTRLARRQRDHAQVTRRTTSVMSSCHYVRVPYRSRSNTHRALHFGLSNTSVTTLPLGVVSVQEDGSRRRRRGRLQPSTEILFVVNRLAFDAFPDCVDTLADKVRVLPFQADDWMLPVLPATGTMYCIAILPPSEGSCRPPPPCHARFRVSLRKSEPGSDRGETCPSPRRIPLNGVTILGDIILGACGGTCGFRSPLRTWPR